MSDEATLKKQIYRARKNAADNLRGVGYGVINTEGGPFDLIGIRDMDARFVRVVVSRKAVDSYVAACRKQGTPPNCYREIWLCKGGKDFEIISIN